MKNKPSATDREPDTTVFPVRIPVEHLAAVTKIAKTRDKTKGSIIREAIRIYLQDRRTA